MRQVVGGTELEVGRVEVDPGRGDDLEGLGQHLGADAVAADHGHAGGLSVVLIARRLSASGSSARARLLGLVGSGLRRLAGPENEKPPTMWTVGEAHTGRVCAYSMMITDAVGVPIGTSSLPRPRTRPSTTLLPLGVEGARTHRSGPTEPVPLGSVTDDESTHLTQATYERLQAELEDLTTRGRVEIARAIEAARALGDLSENGDYHAAKDTQGKMESRIRQLQHTLSHAVIVDDEAVGSSETVAAGSVVAIRYEGDDEIERFLVGSIEEHHDELDVVSPGSPLGQALLGQDLGRRGRVRGARRHAAGRDRPDRQLTGGLERRRPPHARRPAP